MPPSDHPGGHPAACAGIVGCLLLSIVTALPAPAADVVHVSSGDHEGEILLAGEVLDFSGAVLWMRLQDGRQRRLPADNVTRIETSRSDAHQAGEAALARGEVEAARQHYREALRNEQRTWVARQLSAQLVRCDRELGQWRSAGETFLALLEQDPQTPHFDAIPLIWTPVQPKADEIATAESWLHQSDKPVAALLGASLLMATPRRSAAIAELRRLSALDDPRIAALAEAQLWRATIATASDQRVAEWEHAVEQMPEGLRAGPYYLLGTAYGQRQQHEFAALALLRVPFLHADQRGLGARCLLAAGRSLEAIDRRDEAVAVYRELSDVYSNSAEAAAAQRQLEALGASETRDERS